MYITLKVIFSPTETVKFKYENFQTDAEVESFISYLKLLWALNYKWEKLLIYKNRKLVDTMTQ